MRDAYKIASLLLIAGLAPPALAAPELSGPYMTTETDYCQIQAKVDSSTGQITIAKGSDTGTVQMIIYTLAFDPGAGTYTDTGWASSESAIFEQFSDGSHGGSHAKDSALDISGTYSNTDTTLGFEGDPDAFFIVYGPVQNGIAQSFTALFKNGRDKFGKTCLDTIVAQHQ